MNELWAQIKIWRPAKVARSFNYCFEKTDVKVYEKVPQQPHTSSCPVLLKFEHMNKQIKGNKHRKFQRVWQKTESFQAIYIGQ